MSTGSGTSLVQPEAISPLATARTPRCVRALSSLAWTYVVVLAGVWAVIAWGGDRWWLPTVMMFGPKWVYAAPLPLLVAGVVACRSSRRTWLALGAAAVLVLLPIGRCCIPWRRLLSRPAANFTVLTCNTGRERCDARRLAELIAEVRPDAVCLQECREELDRIFGSNWQVLRSGNIVVASPYPVERLKTINRDLPGRWPRPIAEVVKIDGGARPVYLATVHLLSPRHGLAQITNARTVLAPSQRSPLVLQTQWRRSEQERLSRELQRFRGPLIIAGDFNTPATSSIYRACWGDRENGFTCAGWGPGNTVCIDQGGWSFWARIDHIVATKPWRTSRCWVGPDVGSDHRPLIATLSDE